MVAFGGNDNVVTLWNICDITKPHLRFTFKHKAAVKALAFCPWAPSLLATGGGSKDRTLKFWHTRSGALVKAFHTDSQITSIRWSTSSKQLAVTFGFGTNSSVLSVYSFPEMHLLAHVPATRELRLLSSSLSPDGKHLCVAASDTTFRIYQLWDGKSFKSSAKGVYGSELIELAEGSYRNEGVVR